MTSSVFLRSFVYGGEYLWYLHRNCALYRRAENKVGCNLKKMDQLPSSLDLSDHLKKDLFDSREFQRIRSEVGYNEG
jgi:hypothetical protein